uniref:Mitochondrial ribosomal protein L57 n=1 Tax=Paramormyrops kingsleyae TaxID=1676925 RepID=A0A3B3QGE1_9TELE|nr:ribosomal protein 63, mitochondrial [Paramormyrops kingsleyae]
MFLTLALFRKGIPGKQWIGKYRRPRHVTWQMKRNMIARLEHRHAAERRLQNWLNFKEATAGKLPEHRFIAEHLGHLNTTKKWSNQ